MKQNQEILSLSSELDELEEILKMYADEDNYWTETRACEFISNGVREETSDCTSNDSEEAIKGLEILDIIRSKTIVS